MARFKGVIRNVTLGKEDMKKLLSMPLDEIDEWSPVKVRILPKWEDVSRTLAKAMIEKIKENNAKGKPSTFIIPAGSYARPPLMYPYVVEMSVKERINWKNAWTLWSRDKQMNMIFLAYQKPECGVIIMVAVPIFLISRIGLFFP